MDLLRLQKALLMCRMAANSTFLVNKEEPGYSTKLDHLDDLFDELFAEEGRKVVLFSEWTTMLDLIEKLLQKRKLDFVRLDGSVPQKQRQELVHQFQTDAACKLFITTNAGSTGLNLQAANTVINVDLPWNPAVLEQRIARAHRMGQTQPVQVFVLVTEETIEENLLATIAAKRDLALAALDAESEVEQVDLATRHRGAQGPSGGSARGQARGAGGREPQARQRGSRAKRTPRNTAGAWPPPAANSWAPPSISWESWWARKTLLRRPPRWWTTSAPAWTPAWTRTPTASRGSRSRCRTRAPWTDWRRHWPGCWRWEMQEARGKERRLYGAIPSCHLTFRQRQENGLPFSQLILFNGVSQGGDDHGSTHGRCHSDDPVGREVAFRSQATTIPSGNGSQVLQRLRPPSRDGLRLGT